MPLPVWAAALFAKCCSSRQPHQQAEHSHGGEVELKCISSCCRIKYINAGGDVHAHSEEPPDTHFFNAPTPKLLRRQSASSLHSIYKNVPLPTPRFPRAISVPVDLGDATMQDLAQRRKNVIRSTHVQVTEV